MFKRISTNTINTILIIGVILLILEVVFFSGGLIFSVLVSALMAYLGWRKYKVMWGKGLFWIGLIILVFTILSMIAVRFLIVAIIFLVVRDYFQSRKNPEYVMPEIKESDQEFPEPSEPLLTQRFFGAQSTPSRSYPWQDINIQGGFGDRTIDLSHAVMPEEEAVISIRHLVGNIVIYIPYEVEVTVHHSAGIGRVAIFQYRKTKVFNQLMSYKSPAYHEKKPRVKIVTSLLSGDLEVKRI